MSLSSVILRIEYGKKFNLADPEEFVAIFIMSLYVNNYGDVVVSDAKDAEVMIPISFSSFFALFNGDFLFRTNGRNYCLMFPGIEKSGSPML